jgi:hypothetical protein
VDRLIALVALRWRVHLRVLARARETVVGLFLMIPALLFLSVGGSFAVFFGLGALEERRPEVILPLLSAVITGIGVFWALSPLLAGVAFVESHDMSRLLHFPIPLTTLVLSSLLANLLQPMVVAAFPVFLAFGFAVSENAFRLPFVLTGGALTFVFVLATSQLSGLLLHGLSRNRRLQDLALFVGLGFGFAISILPFLLVAGGGRSLRSFGRIVVGTDLFALSPFAWGLRAAVYAGRGELLEAATWGAGGLFALLGVIGLSSVLVQRIYRGELDVGVAGEPSARGSRIFFGGTLGALLEKDLRVTWREPALRASLVMGLVGPLLFLFFLSRGGENPSGRAVLILASFVGIATFGSNAFGPERRGITLLFGFPIPRWKILVGKNLTAFVFRLPGVIAMLVVGAFVAPLAFLPAALSIALITFLVCIGMDNYMSILFPIPIPAPGSNPYGGGAAGGRGLGAASLSALLLMASLVLSSPFVFLAWLPIVLGLGWVWLLSLPLALAGGAAVYAMLVGGAAKLLSRREPEILERILGEW